MNRVFEKEINGSLVHVKQEDIVIPCNGFNIINPTKYDIINAGWVLSGDYELTEDELNEEKEKKKLEIKNYYNSSAVKNFYLDNKAIWFDNSTRVSLLFKIESEIKVGYEVTKLWYNNMLFVMPINQAKEMLFSIELYDSKCSDITNSNILSVDDIKNITDLNSFDYKSGYPEILKFFTNNGDA